MAIPAKGPLYMDEIERLRRQVAESEYRAGFDLKEKQACDQRRCKYCAHWNGECCTFAVPGSTCGPLMGDSENYYCLPYFALDINKVLATHANP